MLAGPQPGLPGRRERSLECSKGRASQRKAWRPTTGRRGTKNSHPRPDCTPRIAGSICTNTESGAFWGTNTELDTLWAHSQQLHGPGPTHKDLRPCGADHLNNPPSEGPVLPEAQASPCPAPSPRLSWHCCTETPTSQAHCRGKREPRSFCSTWYSKGKGQRSQLSLQCSKPTTWFECASQGSPARTSGLCPEWVGMLSPEPGYQPLPCRPERALSRHRTCV